MAQTIVAVDKQSKVLYGLYNLFVPFFLFAIICANIFEDFTNSNNMFVISVLFFITFLYALILFVCGIFSYRNFVQIDDKYLYICRKTGGRIAVINKIQKDNIKEVKKSSLHGIKIITNSGKHVKLFNCTPSYLLMVLTAPIFVIPYALKTGAMIKLKIDQINLLLGIDSDNIQKNIDNTEKQMRGINIFCWIFLALFILLGAFGFFMGGVIFLYFILVTIFAVN